MSISWITEFQVPATGTTQASQAPFISAGISWNVWESGDYVPFISFSLSGETLQSALCKAVIDSVEYTSYLTVLGGGENRLDFRYTENPAWAGGTAGSTLTLQAKVVTNLNTYYSGTGEKYICGQTSSPNPADDSTAVSVSTTELEFTCATYDVTDATPFIGKLYKGGISVLSRNLPVGGVFNISGITLESDTEYTWRVDTDTDGSTITGPVWSFTTVSGLSKPTTPTPANSSGPGINFSTRTLSWVNGGGATGYRIKFPFADATETQSETSYVIPENLIDSFSGTVTWRVDATDGADWVTGDTWTFDPRPGKATTPVPSNSGTGISKGLSTVSWAAGGYADSYDVVLSWFGGVTNPNTSGTSYDFGALTPLYFNPLSYNTEHTWRVDSVNEWGTTTGDTWSFTTLDLDYQKTIYFYPGTGWYYLIWDDSTNSWGDPPPVGTIDVDYKVATFINFIGSHRCLVSLAKDSLWYESVN